MKNQGLFTTEAALWTSLLFYQIVIYMMATSFVQVTMNSYSKEYNILLAISWVLSVPTSITLLHYCLYGRLSQLGKEDRQSMFILAAFGSFIAIGILFIAWVMFYVIIMTLVFIFVIQIWSGYKLFIQKRM